MPLTTQIPNFLAGQKKPGTRWLDVISPATGEVQSQVADGSSNDLEAAVSAAKNVMIEWQQTPVAERCQLLTRLADLMAERAREFAEAESRATGKPITLATTLDIPRSIANLRYFAACTQEFHGSAYRSPAGINYTDASPHGIVAAIVPWNLPLYLLTWKVAPALATGNCVIAKASELTPQTASLLAEIATAAGLPSGTLSVVHGRGAGIGQEICQHPDITAVSFTGGTTTGEHIAKTCAERFKKVALELGGKNPAVVLADCKLDTTVAGLVKASFLNQGQICHCPSRIYVANSIYQEFRQKFVDKTQALRLGDPEDPHTEFGAVISLAHRQKVLDAIALAQEEGCEILTGGDVATMSGRCQGGFFVQPTVIEPTNPKATINAKETFGPVVTIQPVASTEEALTLANDTSYGLSATVWGRDIGTCQKVAHQLRAGTVWVNSWMVRDLRVPIGGWGDSGVAEEGGQYALDFFTRKKNTFIPTPT